MTNETPQAGVVVAVCRNATHDFIKPSRESITLVVGFGVDGDAHMGATVKHRSRVAADPTQPNLRQVHLIPGELHDELRAKGFRVGPGIMGENVTIRGIDLLALPRGTQLHLGATAAVEVTGLRNPCAQLNDYQEGLMAAVLRKDSKGNVIRRAGIMSVVVAGGDVRRGDPVKVVLPPEPHVKLERV
jgi:MOSC domain